MKKILVLLFAILLAAGISVKASDLVIESKSQNYAETDQKIKFNGDVKVTIDDLKVVGDKADVNVLDGAKLDTATFYDKPYAFEIKKNKKREVKANILKVSLITKIIRAEGDTQSVVFDGKTPVVVINADVQEYNTKTGVMRATGTVTMLYKDIESYSNEAEITTDKNGDLKKLVLIGNARVKQDNNETVADKLVYDATTENVTATGRTTSTVYTDDGTKMVLKSGMQEYNQKRGVFNASNNVRIWYDDYYAAGPKVSLYPGPNGKPNEANFIGRSSITQGVRTIYADRIKMTMKPKTFDAKGNTRTVIKNIGSNTDENVTLGL
ncbi:hypothetical protein J6N69_05470 [bacterium]|nr:hypothetical protein [bacterium]MBP3846454.1 hypothetical protein [bacterium]